MAYQILCNLEGVLHKRRNVGMKVDMDFQSNVIKKNINRNVEKAVNLAPHSRFIMDAPGGRHVTKDDRSCK